MCGARAEIIKPYKEWLCDYCSMGPQVSWDWWTAGHSALIGGHTLCLSLIGQGPEDCGLPILCIFYILLLLIICLTIYTTIRGTRA